MIFTDIDETIKVKHKPLTDFCNKVFFELTNKGVLIVPTTGRDRTRAEDFTRCYGGSNYIITSNGANVFDTKLRQDIFKIGMDKDSALKIYDYAIKQGCRVFVNVNADFRFSSNKNLEFAERHIDNINDVLNNYIVYQIVVQGISNKQFDDFKHTIEDIGKIKIGNICGEDDNHSLDIVDAKVSKGKAVKFLLDYLQINKNNAIAFGNDFNDISMFEQVGKSFCVNNAIEKLKPVATQTIGSVFEDGVPRFLIEYYNLNLE